MMIGKISMNILSKPNEARMKVGHPITTLSTGEQCPKIYL